LPIRKIAVWGGEGVAVELLGQGNQFAAIGEHPDTGKPYAWQGESPLDSAPWELPSTTPELLRAFANEVRDLFVVEGYANAKVTGHVFERDPALGVSVRGEPICTANLAAVLGHVSPEKLYPEWAQDVASIRSANLSDGDESALLDIACAWSRGDYSGKPCAAYEKGGEGEVVRVFDSFDPNLPGGRNVGSLVRQAREAGYAGPADARPAVPLAETYAGAVAALTPPPALPRGPVAFSDVLAREVPPVAELIAGLVERRVVTFLAGPGGVHKSRLALQWGLCLDAGAPIFGRTVQPATFVYLSCEDHADEVARRTQAITRRLKLPPGGSGQFWDLTADDATLAVVHDSGACEPTPSFDKLEGWLRSIAGHKFVVVDSTYNVLRFEGSAKINEGGVKAAIALLQRLCDDADCTLLVLWHPSQSGQDRGDASGWSVAWHNAPRARLSLSAVKERDDAFDLKVEKRNHGAKGQPITLHWADGALLPRADLDVAGQESTFRAACVSAAISAAETGQAIQKQRRPPVWVFEEIERATGRRPTHRELKDELDRAQRDQQLRYVAGTTHKMAGFYPLDMERAAELALQAKHVRPDEPASPN
jgi:hypothetical protein